MSFLYVIFPVVLSMFVTTGALEYVPSLFLLSVIYSPFSIFESLLTAAICLNNAKSNFFSTGLIINFSKSSSSCCPL